MRVNLGIFQKAGLRIPPKTLSDPFQCFINHSHLAPKSPIWAELRAKLTTGRIHSPAVFAASALSAVALCGPCRNDGSVPAWGVGNGGWSRFAGSIDTTSLGLPWDCRPIDPSGTTLMYCICRTTFDQVAATPNAELYDCSKVFIMPSLRVPLGTLQGFAAANAAVF